MSNNNQASGLQSIEQKFLNTGDLFALRFNQGLVFLEVTGWEQNKYAPYNGVGVIGSQDSSGFQRLEDDGDDILYMEKRQKKVIHAGIGQSPAVLRRYTNYPEGENRLRSIPNLSTPKAGEDFGYVDGDESPYNGPTDVEELFVAPGIHLDFDFYNPDNEAHEPILNIKMREYNIRALDPRREENRNAIKRIISPGSPIPVSPAGSLDNQADFDLEQFWDTTPITPIQARKL